MEDENALDRLAEIAALKLLLGKLYYLYFAEKGPAAFAAFQKAVVEGASTRALVRTSDPATSDVVSALVEEKITDLLARVAATLCK